MLDGMQLRNVIYKNVHVVYHGSPLIMENVYFIDCTFDVSSGQNGSLLADTLLSSTPVTVKIG
jgi:hypothetical protein